MPTISMFYGIVIYMFSFDNKKHNLPHVHAVYGEHTAVIDIKNGKSIEGNLPPRKMKLVQAWMEIHKEDLLADWQLTINGQQLFKIDPLR